MCCIKSLKEVLGLVVLLLVLVFLLLTQLVLELILETRVSLREREGEISSYGSLLQVLN
jgi:hypothetical protein